MKIFKKLFSCIPSGITCLVVFFLLFGYLASQMGTANTPQCRSEVQYIGELLLDGLRIIYEKNKK